LNEKHNIFYCENNDPDYKRLYLTDMETGELNKVKETTKELDGLGSKLVGLGCGIESIKIKHKLIMPWIMHADMSQMVCIQVDKGKKKIDLVLLDESHQVHII